MDENNWQVKEIEALGYTTQCTVEETGPKDVTAFNRKDFFTTEFLRGRQFKSLGVE